MTELQHTCRQGKRCKSRVRDDEGAYKGGGVERPDSLCRPCEESAFAAMGKLSYDWDRLEPALSEPRLAAAILSFASSPGADHPIPIRTDVDAVMVDIVMELVRWVRIVTKGDDLPRDAGECVKRCVVILGANKGTLVDLPMRTLPDWQKNGEKLTVIRLDGVEAVLRLARLHDRAVAVLGEVEKVQWLPTACHMCGRKALTPSEDQETVKCRGCANVWSREEFARLNNPLGYEEVS